MNELEQNLEHLAQEQAAQWTNEQPNEQPQENIEQLSEKNFKEMTAEEREIFQKKNFKEMRDKMSRLEKERDEYYQRLQELQNQSTQTDDEITIGPDDIAEGKHLSKLQKKVKNLEQQLKNQYQQSAESLVEQRLKLQFPDFDKVVNAENVQALSQADPELAATIGSNPDLYTKAVTAYKQIKKMGIIPDATYDADKAKAAANSSKPRPLSSVSPQQGESPLTRANAFANGLTPELQKQLYKEMVDAQKNS